MNREWFTSLLTGFVSRKALRKPTIRSSHSTEQLEERTLLTSAAVTLHVDEISGNDSPGIILKGEEFDVRLSVSDMVNGQAAFSGYADLSFDHSHLEALSITFDEDYASGRTGVIENSLGNIDELGAVAGFSIPADSRIATVRFRAKAAGVSTISTNAGEADVSEITLYDPDVSGDRRNDASFSSLEIASFQLLSLTLNVESISESAGAAATFGTLSLASAAETDLTVVLSSNDETEVTVPATVTIAAGKSSEVFSIDIVDEAIVDGLQTVTITASSSGFTTDTRTLDVTDDDSPPAVLSIDRADSDTTNADSVAFTVTFDVPVSGIETGDFVVAGSGTSGTVAGVSATSGSSVTVTVNSVSGDGALGLNFDADAAGGVSDAAGNASTADFAGQAYTIDNTAPVVLSIDRADSDTTNADSVAFTVTFDVPVSGIETGDFVVAGSGTSGTVAGVSATSGSSVTVTVNSVSGDGALGLNFDADAAGGVSDAAGNASTADFAGQAYTIDNTAPVVFIDGVTPDPRQNAVESISIVFSEAVDSFSNGNLRLTHDGGANLLAGTEGLTTSDHATFTLSGLSVLTRAAGDYELTLVSNDAVIHDAAGNFLNGAVIETWTFEGIAIELAADGRLLITERSPTGLNGNLTVTTIGADLVIRDPTNVLTAAVGSAISDHEVRVPVASFPGGQVVVELGPGDDLFDASVVTNVPFFVDTGGGNDTVKGGAASDTLHGGAGNDSILGNNGSDRILGGPGSDAIHGGDDDDSIDGGQGNDELSGGPGVDLLLVSSNRSQSISPAQTTGAGTDLHSEFEQAHLINGPGNNLLDASESSLPVTLFGNDGNDTLFGSVDNDSVFDGGDGRDVVQITGTDITLSDASAPGSGAAQLISIEALLLIAAGRGSRIDASTYTLGPVIIIGSSGADTLIGGQSDDLIMGGSGPDEIHGNGGDDRIHGGHGQDIIDGGAGRDSIFGGRGRDTITGGANDDLIRGGANADSLRGNEGNDEISGGGGPDTIFGGAGNDHLRGMNGRDGLNGGEGADQIEGDSGRDTLLGLSGDDTLDGGASRDILIGGHDDDDLDGGRGVDSLAGGDGADQIREPSQVDDSFSELAFPLLMDG